MWLFELALPMAPPSMYHIAWATDNDLYVTIFLYFIITHNILKMLANTNNIHIMILIH